jgi:predicted amidohydrolase YtcJ
MSVSDLRGGTVLDGTGASPSVADVRIRDRHIEAIGIGLDEDNVVDCSGKILLPGLIDCHIHAVSTTLLDQMRRLDRAGRLIQLPATSRLLPRLTPVEFKQVHYRQHPALTEALVPTS